MTSETTFVTVNAEGMVDAEAEQAIIRFTRQGLYDKTYNTQTELGTKLRTNVLAAGAKDVKVVPTTGRTTIIVEDLEALGSVVAGLRELGPVAKVSTSFVVTDETHGFMVGDALAAAVERARADIEPTVRLLEAGFVRVTEVQTVKVKAIAGTWRFLSARIQPASAWVRARVTFALEGTESLDISDELKEIYDHINDPRDEPAGPVDPFGGDDFGVVVAPASADPVMSSMPTGYSAGPQPDYQSIQISDGTGSMRAAT